MSTALVLASLLVWRLDALAATEPNAPGKTAVATFAGGCFWCVEADFDAVPGVVKTVSGYTGGHVPDPGYERVTRGDTGHREAVEVYYDPTKVSYEALLDVFWRSVDPTDDGGQFCDRGTSYTTAIFVHSAMERREAEASRRTLGESGILGAPVVTAIEDAAAFYPAEDYHQNYYEKNPIRYKLYRLGCRRDARIEALWGDQAHRGIEKH